MITFQMGDLEAKFADIIWAHQPISSADLAELAAEAFGWKKTTSYTVLKRLCNKGIFSNVKAQVTACISRAEFYGGKAEEFIRTNYEGSLESFLTSYLDGRSLSQEEAGALHMLIDGHVR